jgi:hypothetical protein
LGYEKKRVFGLREFFYAEDLYLFYTDNNLYTKTVLDKNKEVLDETPNDHRFPYHISDLIYTKMLLQDLCETLSKKYRIVIAPCGPKPFTLLCFIVASMNNNIDVWRISASDDDTSVSDREPDGNILTLKMSYTRSKTD